MPGAQRPAGSRMCHVPSASGRAASTSATGEGLLVGRAPPAAQQDGSRKGTAPEPSPAHRTRHAASDRAVTQDVVLAAADPPPQQHDMPVPAQHPGHSRCFAQCWSLSLRAPQAWGRARSSSSTPRAATRPAEVQGAAREPGQCPFLAPAAGARSSPAVTRCWQPGGTGSPLPQPSAGSRQDLATASCAAPGEARANREEPRGGTIPRHGRNARFSWVPEQPLRGPTRSGRSLSAPGHTRPRAAAVRAGARRAAAGLPPPSSRGPALRRAPSSPRGRSPRPLPGALPR